MLRDSLQGLRILRSYRNLVKEVRRKNPVANLETIRRAFLFAHKAHKEQRRLSGEPFIIHPLAVATTLAQLGLDTETIAAGLLHDVVEDTAFGQETIRREFGDEIQVLVQSVTKISHVKKSSILEQGNLSELKAKEAAENIRQMLLATNRDIRVILIKLADKLHNMQTLRFQKPHKIHRIAQEVIDIYAPIAARLGMFRMKSELEDLAFMSLQPQEYKSLQRQLKESRKDLEQFIKKTKETLDSHLHEISPSVKIAGRAKHLYSVYSKMQKYKKSLNEIYDLRGVRIIVDNVKDCYGTLGIVHTLWPPVPGRFKDYIAMPKSNGYQSLHTTVIGGDGKPLEIQIRTEEMDKKAEHGIAAHWLYKSDIHDKKDQQKIDWLQKISLLTSDQKGDSTQFIADLRDELIPEDVYVFTPKGEIISLPWGATVLDFAFHVHTDIGLRCKSAKINDRIVPLRTELHSGDRVEILTHNEPHPSPSWLTFLSSQRARQKVRAYFRKLEEELNNHPDLMKGRSASFVKTNHIKNLNEIRIRRKTSTNPKDVPIEVAGHTDIPVRYAGCCTPVPGDHIIGYITRGRGVTIHKADCKFLPTSKEDQDRFIPVRWEGLIETYPVSIEISAKDRQGLYLDLVQALAKTQSNILKAEADIPKHKDGTMKARFLVEVDHVDHLNEIIERMKQVNGVINVKRLTERRVESKV